MRIKYNTSCEALRKMLLKNLNEFAICLELFTMTHFLLYLLGFPGYLWHLLNNVCLTDVHNLFIS